MPQCNPSAASCSISSFEAQVPCYLAYSSSIINSAVCSYVKNNQTICQGGDFAGLNSCLSNTTMDFECNASTSGSGITLQKSLGSLKIASMLLLALSACFVNAQEAGEATTAQILDLLESTPKVDQVAYLGNLAVVVTSVEYANTSVVDDDARKRDRPCVTQTVNYKQVQVKQSGSWNGNWEKALPCLYTGLEPLDASQGITWGESHSISYSADFDLSVSDLLLDAIKGNAGLNFGYQWTTSKSKGGSKSCPVPANSVGQIWVQKKWGWSDSQVRDCHYLTGPCGSLGSVCGAYSGYQHADWPIDGNDVDNNG